MADEQRPPRKIALWGATAAGKTMLLARLPDVIHQVESDWDLVKRPQGDKFLKSIKGPLAENRFPGATTGGAAEAWYEFRHKITGRAATLSVDDRAGDHWETLEEGGEYGAAAMARLKDADGFVMLIDIERDERAMRDAVLRTADHLANEGGTRMKEPRPVAVCVSKIDGRIRSRAEFEAIHADPHGYARRREWLPASLDRLFQSRFERYRVFPLSAAGVFVRGSVVEPAAFYDEDLELRFRSDGLCIGLLAPFTWLFDLLNAEPV